MKKTTVVGTDKILKFEKLRRKEHQKICRKLERKQARAENKNRTNAAPLARLRKGIATETPSFTVDAKAGPNVGQSMSFAVAFETPARRGDDIAASGS